MTKPLDQRILDLYESLSPSEQRLADVMLQNQREIAAYSATELAGQAGVSKATAGRLVRRLGYDSFEDMRRQSRSDPGWGSPLKTLERFEAEPVRAQIEEHLQNDLANLRRSFERLSPQLLDDVVGALSNARTIYVVGLRNSFSLAHYARFTLTMLKPDVRLVPMGGLSFSEEFIDLDRQDVVLAIGFRRRPLILRHLLAYGRERGATIVYVTDLSASRTEEIAHFVLRCHSRGSYLYDSYTAAFSILNYIASALALSLGSVGRERLAAVDLLHQELDVFTTPRKS